MDTTSSQQPHVGRLGYRPELDGIRGIAVLAVVLFHTGLRALPGGWLGVDLFFVLSGFLITTLLLEERATSGRVDVRAFYVRRALRLLPALGLLLVVLADLVVVGATRSSTIRDIPWVFGFATNWAYVGSRPFGPLTHLWSLAVEEQFYLVWPAVLVLLARRLPSARHQAIAIGTTALTIATTRSVLYLTDVVSPRRAYFGGDLRADALLLGCLLAVAHTAGWLEPLAPRLRRLWWPALLLLAVVALTPASPFSGIGPLLFVPVDVAAAVLVAGAVAAPTSIPVLRWRPLVRVGVLSYSLYLWHLPLMLAFTLSPALRLLVAAPLALLAAVVSRRLVEQPALRWKHRLAAARAPEPVRSLVA